MRTIVALSLAFSTLLGASAAHANITTYQAASRIKAAVVKSDKVIDKQGKFHTQLGAVVPGTKYVRTFQANNMRQAAVGDFRLTIGGAVTGKINLRTEKVTVLSYAMAR